MVGRGQVYVPFQLSDLREIKKHLDSYTDAQTYIQAFIFVIQTFQLTWKDMMLLLDQTFLIRKAMGSGPDHSGWKWLPLTMSPNTSGTWKWGNNCAYLQGHRQSPWQIHTKKGWWYGSSSKVPLCRNKVLGSFPQHCLTKQKKMVRKISGVSVTSAIT
jgi:hypothetical protein